MNQQRGLLSSDVRPLVRRLGKLPGEWQREDLITICEQDGLRIVNLRFPALDGKLRELRVPINDRRRLDQILAAGERVDGSSLFPGLFDPGASDLYVVPVYRWAFPNPWAADELDVVCRFADHHGVPCAVTPDNVLIAAAERLQSDSALRLMALAELEFYLILDRANDRFSGRAQRSYQQSEPYLHGRAVVDEMLRIIGKITGAVKYAHSEVGYIDKIESNDRELDGRRVEQHEIEFDLMPIEDLGCWLPVSRWLIRVIADRCGASVTFLPKLDEGMAGSGLHLHLAIEKQGTNLVEQGDGGLSEPALRLIGGLLERARSLSGFGNTVAASYLRLVPGQEAPTRVCWGRRNRLSLIRVPLSFRTNARVDLAMNPGEQSPALEDLSRPTIEYRGPDGSAFTHLLLAAVTACVAEGLVSASALQTARELEVAADFAGDAARLTALPELPTTAVAAAELLRRDRGFYEAGGIPARLIDIVIGKLEQEADAGLSARLRGLPAAERLAKSRQLMHKDLHKH